MTTTTAYRPRHAAVTLTERVEAVRQFIANVSALLRPYLDRMEDR